MAARINLRTDLPKVRAQWSKVVEAQKERACDYTAPCVIGAMITPSKRSQMQAGYKGNSGVDDLLGAGMLLVPKDQEDDVVRLQRAFDGGNFERLTNVLSELERKYLPEQVA